MRDYLTHEFDPNDPDLVSVIDELPLWSAPFGLRLLDTITLVAGMRVLDIGCGLGFPLIEISQRLGSSGRVVGVDPWERAIERIRLKLRTYAIDNVEVVTAVAECLPFADQTFDLLVSNNGLNNVQELERALAECHRVARTGAQLVHTFNLPDTMGEFYSSLKAVLEEHGMQDRIGAMVEHIHSKRLPVVEMQALLGAAGFEVKQSRLDSFQLRFVDAEAMFNHYLIKYWFLPAWKEGVGENGREAIFEGVEKKMNATSQATGQIVLSVPFVTLDCRRR